MNCVRLLSVSLFLALVAGCGRGASMPSTPDGTIEKVTDDLAADKPQVIWYALPPKYQTDVKSVITAFADKMDPELWNQTFAALNKLAQVAKGKKEFIMGAMQNVPQLDAEKREKLDEHWDRVVGIFENIVNSDIKTVAGLKALDPEKFLSTTGSKLSRDVKDLAAAVGNVETSKTIDKLEDTKVTVVKSDGDKATLNVEVPKQPAQKIEMVKVDGKWLPADMVANWDTEIERVKQSISRMDFSGPSRERFLGMLKQVDQTLDKMLAAQTQEEFNQAAGGLMMMMPLPGPGTPSAGDQTTLPDFANQPSNSLTESETEAVAQPDLIKQLDSDSKADSDEEE
jgi:hypothetical protein